MKSIKRVFSLFLVVCILAGLVPAYADTTAGDEGFSGEQSDIEEPAVDIAVDNPAPVSYSASGTTATSGQCGDNVYWELDEATGTLTISGTGEMWYDYAYSSAYDKNSIKSVIIYDGVTSIGQEAFYGCDNLTSISIPDSVTSIGDSAFTYCRSLTSVHIPDGVTSIGYWTFGNCYSLTSINIPDGVTSIGDDAFDGCSNLTSISIPDSVTFIGDYAFDGCESLTRINIPDNVTSIGDSTFNDCYSLTSVRIPDSVTSIGEEAFVDCDSLTSISIPGSVTSIGDYAFYHCTNLTSVHIHDGVTSIGLYTFRECSSLTSVRIPDSLAFIGAGAFHLCYKLETVYYSGTRVDWDAITFNGNTELTNANIIFAETTPEDYETGNGTDPEVSNLYVVGRTPDKKTVDRASVFECEFNLPVRKPEADEPDSYITVKDGYHVDPIYTLNTKSDLVQVDGSKVYFDLGNAELEEGTLYFIIFDEGSVYALDGTPFYGMKYNLVDNKAWQFQISGADSDVTLKWDTKGHLWWKDDDESKPPYPDGTDEEYAAVIAKWAREAGIENVTEATAAAMLDEPAYLPVTDVNNSTWLLNDGGTTVRQVVEDLIFIENLQPYLDKLDRNLEDRGEAYKMIMDWNDQIQDYLRKRSGKSNMFFSAAMPLAHEALTYLTKGVGGDVYKYTKPILKANIDQSIQDSSMSGLEAYDNYHDYKEAVSEIGEAVSTGKSVYKALAGGGASGWLKLGWDMFSEYYNGAGSDVIDEITSVLADVVKIKGAMQIAMAVGNTAALFPLVMDFYSRSMKGIKDNVAGMYFVYYYYIFDKYPQIYEMLYDESNDSPSDYYLSDVMANYAGKILDDPILESWVDYMEKTDADKYLQRECTQLRRDLANYALLLLYAKSIDISEAQEGLARYLSAELSDAETMRDILIGSCPVRINIYSNSTGELAASLSSEDPDIMDCEYGTLYLMGENNETKCFVLNSGDYSAEILPYDNGTMDVLLTEVGENGEMTSAYYEDVELVEGQTLSLSGLKPDAELENNGQTVQPEAAIPVGDILLTAPAELAVGENAELGVEIMPATATEQGVSWESSNPDIVDVSGGGVITAKAAGDAEITATAGGVSQSVEISVYLPAESITLDVESVTMCAGEELPVSASVYPSDATHDVQWSSSAGSVAMVDENGCINALSEGMAVLTAEVDGAEAYINVTVYEQPVNVIIYQSDTNGDRIKVDMLNGSLYTNFTGSVFVALYDGAGRMITVTELPAALGAGTHVTSYVPVDGLGSYDGLQAKAFAVNGQMAPVSVSVSMPLIA